MPRRMRVFVAGAVYHVYGRVTHGGRVFANEDEARRFVTLLGEVKKRDGFTLFAWCLMANHYHLAIRTATIPLWRTMRLVAGRFALEHNRRRRVLGPLWQGRYQARLVEDERYLLQLIAYIHLNPVAAGVVRDPARYRWSGHREILVDARAALVDAREVLALFGRTRDASRRAYVKALRGERNEAWFEAPPGRLPWWRRAEEEDQVAPTAGAVHLDAMGRSSAPERERLDAGEFVRRAVRVLGIEAAALGGRGKTAEVARARELIALVGVEAFALRVKALAERLGMNPGSVSRWLTRGAQRRMEDAAFREAYGRLEWGVVQESGATSRW